MGVVLKLTLDTKASLWSHLLPDVARREEAAFLYVTPERDGADVLHVREIELLGRDDFASQSFDHLELAHDARQRLIRKAHALKASLAEFHSHPSKWPAEFSRYDRTGLAETVRHMRWRLNERPYLAVVVAPTSYDGLAWTFAGGDPKPLLIEVDGVEMRPTGRSLGVWNVADR